MSDRIYRINKMSESEKRQFYRVLIPERVFSRYNIDPETFCDEEGNTAVRYYYPPGDTTAMVEIKRRTSDIDPVFSIQISDAIDVIQLNWDFIIINDPDAPRFNIDIDDEGKDTLFGRATRNLPEELKALKAGLAPGQVRRGLRMLGETIECLEEFCRMVSLKSIFMEALFYHNAVAYERYGFTYFEGYKRMVRLNELFAPGGKLARLLNESQPFRNTDFCSSVRGRSWAIHDDIIDEIDDPVLDEPWHSPRMYKIVGENKNVCTCPDIKIY